MSEEIKREDPLERLERQEAERKARGGNLRTIAIILTIVAILLAAALAYIWFQKSTLVNALEDEKADLTEQIEALQADYATLSSDYEVLNSQLDSSREEVAQLVDRIKELSAQVSSYKEQVAVNSVLKARGITLQAYNGSDKLTDRSSRIVRMMVSLTLNENGLAPKGPVRVYVRVKDPEGNLLLDGTGASFTVGGAAMAATASREVDYTGSDVDLSIYVNNVPEYHKGVYSAEVYTAQSLLGKAEVLLR